MHSSDTRNIATLYRIRFSSSATDATSIGMSSVYMQ